MCHLNYQKEFGFMYWFYEMTLGQRFCVNIFQVAIRQIKL